MSSTISELISSSDEVSCLASLAWKTTFSIFLTFVGEPERVYIPNDIEDFTNDIWNNLNYDNKISLYVRYTDLETKEIKEKLINKNGERK